METKLKRLEKDYEAMQLIKIIEKHGTEEVNTELMLYILRIFEIVVKSRMLTGQIHVP